MTVDTLNDQRNFPVGAMSKTDGTDRPELPDEGGRAIGHPVKCGGLFSPVLWLT